MESDRRISYPVIFIIACISVGGILLVPASADKRDGYIMNLLLSSMHDTMIDTPLLDECLVYNGTFWINDSCLSGGNVTALNDLSDVTIITPLDNMLIAYNETSGQWENEFVEFVLRGIILDDLADVDTFPTSANAEDSALYKFFSKSSDPTTTDIPSGYCATYKNTTTSVVKYWCNDGGTLKGIALV